MHLAKLVRTLQAFDTPTLIRVKEYVNSPFFKVPKCGVVLMNYMYQLHPKFSDRKVNVEAISSLGESLNTSAKQSWAATKILDAIDNFLAYEQWQKNSYDVARYTLNGLKDIHLFEEFEKQYHSTQKQLDGQMGQDIETFFQRHLLTEASLNGFDAKLKRTNKNDLAPVLQTLDEFYALKKLRYLCEVMERQRIFGSKYKSETVFPLLDILKPYTNEEHPYVYLFVHVFLMLNADTYEESRGPYEVIKLYAQKSSEGVLSQSLIESMSYATSHCSKWYNKGILGAGDEYLWWIDLRMKKNLLLENGKILPVIFRNIVSIAAISKNNPEWMARFIDRYAPLLPESHREATQNFAYALYAYKRGKYKEAVRHFMTAQAGDEVLFNSVIRRWQFMCLYNFDSQDIDVLINHLSSFEKYLQRHVKQLSSAKIVFDKFIDYSQHLLRVNATDVTEPFMITIKSEEHFPGKPWLVEQFENKLQTARVRIPQVKVR